MKPRFAMKKNKTCMELENGLHNIKVRAGAVTLTNKQTGKSVMLAIESNEHLGDLFDVLFDREI